MAKDLKARVIIDTSNAEKNLDRLIKKLNRTQAALNNSTTHNSKVESAVRRVANQQDQVTKAVNKTNAAHKKSSTLVGMLTTKVKRLAGAYLGVMGAKAVITASDTITSAENKLNNLNATALGSAGYTTDSSGAEVYSQATLDATQNSMDKMYLSAQKVRIAYSDMMNNVSKSMTLANDAFQGNIDNAIRFQEIMGEAYTIGGASAAEMSSSMYQMIQGLGSGILQGDELRSVREGAPLAYKAIEKFAQGIYGAEENLKDLASQGKITSDIVVAAIMDAGKDMDKAFAKTNMTFAQAWTNIKNTALKSFEPVLQKMNELLNSPVGQAIVNGIGKAITIVANVIGLAISHIIWWWNILAKVATWIKDNWSVISKVLLSIISVIAIAMAVMLFPKFIAWISYLGFVIAYYAVVGFMAVKSAIAAAVAWIAANWPLLLIIAILAAIVVALIWVADSFADACGIIVGVIFAAGAIIWNIVAGVVNGIIQYLWTMFVEPFLGVIEWIMNAVNGGFEGVGGAVKNLLGQLISFFISFGKIATKIIDAVFGTDLTSKLNGLQDKVLSWGKKEDAITLDRSAPELKRIAVSDAYSAGYNVGFSGGEWLSNKVSGIGNAISGVGNGLPDAGSDANALKVDGYDPSTLDNIDGNTGKIADSVELTEEDLEYLKDIANMEWKKEYTTASVTIDMTNNNNIQNANDWDGWVKHLSKTLVEELDAQANGTYTYGYTYGKGV